MRVEALLLACFGFGPVLTGCADKASEPAPELTSSGSHLTIIDDDDKVLAKDVVPARGFTALDIVIREGGDDDVDGVFVQFNTTTRFVPWADLLANPLGQRIPSDGFMKAGELGLRLAEEPCGGRAPLLFQVRELRAAVRTFEAAAATDARAEGEHVSLADLDYTTLSGWTESGLYAPRQAKSRRPGERCRDELEEASTPDIEQAPLRLGSAAPSEPDQRAGATAITAASWQPSSAREKEPGSISDGSER